MTYNVMIKEYKGQYAASLPGVPDVRVIGQTRSEAIDALKEIIKQRIQLGELLTLEIESIGITSLAGKYENDQTLREICDRVYQIRDMKSDS